MGGFYRYPNLLAFFFELLKGGEINMQEMINSFGAMLVIFLIISGMYLLIAFFLSYIFTALGIYRIMEKRNIPNAFLAWIPVANMWALGSVYDDIKKKEDDGKDPKFRIIMLAVNLVPVLFSSSLRSTPFFYQFQSNIHFSLDLVSGITSIAFITQIVLYLICLKTIFEKHAPNKSSYFPLSVLFTTIFVLIAPFVPGLLIYKASKNEPENEQKIHHNM